MSDTDTTVIMCSNVLSCKNPGHLKCTRCRGAIPPTQYCSSECQKKDWVSHKKYCGKIAYTFEMKLLESSDPIISRTFDVPSWFTFQQLHHTIQYAMKPLQCLHLHEFTFEIPRSKPRTTLSHRIEILKIGPESLYHEGNAGVPARPAVLIEFEDKVRLKDVFDPAGRLRNTIAPNGEILPLYYLYDLGDNWDHELIFKGEKLARQARPVFSVATGAGPVEDSGGVYGWNRVKAAFKVEKPSAEHRRRRERATEDSGLGEAFDPFKEPDVTVMNDGPCWEKFQTEIKRG